MQLAWRLDLEEIDYWRIETGLDSKGRLHGGRRGRTKGAANAGLCL